MARRPDPVAVADRFLTSAPKPSDVKAVLAAIADELDVTVPRTEALYRARRIAFEIGRDLTEPITLVGLAAAARVSQPQVTRALSKPIPDPV